MLLFGMEQKTTDALKIIKILGRHHVSTADVKERAKQVQERYLVLKRDRSNILLQTKDASQKALEQAKKAKEISGNLDDLMQGIYTYIPSSTSFFTYK